MYDPSIFSTPESSFAFFYNGSTQGPITLNARIAITNSAHNTGWYSKGPIGYTLAPIGDNHFVGRADAIMRPHNPPDQYATFGFLRGIGNVNRGYTHPFSAWQDHPARTTFHTSLTDEALHMYCDDTAALDFAIRLTSVPADFDIDPGRAVIGGFLV